MDSPTKSYQTWELDGGKLIIEKFTGRYTINQATAAIDLVLSLAQKNMPLTVLVDLTEALIGFSSDEVTQVVEIFIKESSKFENLRFAIIVSGEETHEIAFRFAQESSNAQLLSMTFHSLTSALDWLSIDDSLRNKINSILV